MAECPHQITSGNSYILKCVKSLLSIAMTRPGVSDRIIVEIKIYNKSDDSTDELSTEVMD
jgi:hypothetical protein